MILNPETEHAPFDIVAYKEGIFKRVQIKYRKLKKMILLKSLSEVLMHTPEVQSTRQ